LADEVTSLISLLIKNARYYFNALDYHGVHVLSKSIIIMIKSLEPLQHLTITQLMMLLKQ